MHWTGVYRSFCELHGLDWGIQQNGGMVPLSTPAHHPQGCSPLWSHVLISKRRQKSDFSYEISSFVSAGTSFQKHHCFTTPAP